jgi:hypothetical protein
MRTGAPDLASSSRKKISPPHSMSLVLASVLPTACAETNWKEKESWPDIIRFLQRQGINDQHLKENQDYITEFLQKQISHPVSTYDIAAYLSTTHGRSCPGQSQLTSNLSSESALILENIGFPAQALDPQRYDHVALKRQDADSSDTLNIRDEETKVRCSVTAACGQNN